MAVEVKVKLFATLREGRFDEKLMSLDEGSTPLSVIDAIGLAQDAVTVVFINSRHAAKDRPLAEGDVLALFPPVGGG
jgi:molybdopterin converting factor small subunit